MLEETMPKFPNLDELKDNEDLGELTAQLDALKEQYGVGPQKNRRQRRANLTGHSKHSRFIWEKDKDGEGHLVKFHFTKVRPWVRVAESRKRDRIAAASRRKNRGK